MNKKYIEKTFINIIKIYWTIINYNDSNKNMNNKIKLWLYFG